MTLRVLQLGPYPPPEGGISRHILAIRNCMRRNGDECTIVATSRSSRMVVEEDVYHPASALRLLSLLGKLNYDLLHLHLGGNITSRVLSLALACSAVAPGRCVLTLHSGAYPLSAAAKRASPMTFSAFVFRKFARVIVVSKSLAEVVRRFGVPEDRISVVPPHALEPPDESAELPEGLSSFAAGHMPFMVSVGGLDRDYDPLLPITAMGQILNERPSAGLMMIGDGPMRSQVEKFISEKGLERAVHIAGNVSHSQTLQLIDKADAMLRTTLFDGDAISVREALYLETPVIATDNGSRPDGVRLISRGDAQGLCDAIKSLPDRSKTKNNHREPDYSNINSVIDIYRAVLYGSQARRSRQVWR